MDRTQSFYETAIRKLEQIQIENLNLKLLKNPSYGNMLDHQSL